MSRSRHKNHVGILRVSRANEDNVSSNALLSPVNEQEGEVLLEWVSVHDFVSVCDLSVRRDPSQDPFRLALPWKPNWQFTIDVVVQAIFHLS